MCLGLVNGSVLVAVAHPELYCLKKVIVGEGQDCDDTEYAMPADLGFVVRVCDVGLLCKGRCVSPEAGP